MYYLLDSNSYNLFDCKKAEITGWLSWENGIGVTQEVAKHLNKLPVFTVKVGNHGSYEAVTIILNNYNHISLPKDIVNHLKATVGCQLLEVIPPTTQNYFKRLGGRHCAIVYADGEIYEGLYHSEIAEENELINYTNLIYASYCKANELYLETLRYKSLLYLPSDFDYVYIDSGVDSKIDPAEALRKHYKDAIVCD